MAVLLEDRRVLSLSPDQNNLIDKMIVIKVQKLYNQLVFFPFSSNLYVLVI